MITGIIKLTNQHETTDWSLQTEEGTILKT